MDSKITDRIIERIAKNERRDPAELELILQEHISTDALRTLADHESDSWRLQFETESHVVEISRDGTILVDGESP